MEPLFEVELQYQKGKAKVTTFWMHQLTEDVGADQQLCLNPQQINNVIDDLIEKNI